MVHKLFHMKLHLWPTHYHIHIIHVNSIPMNNMHFKYTLGHMKYTIQGIQNLCYLDAEVNGKLSIFFLFSLSLSSCLQFSLPGLTLEMMIFNSTYFSSPFDNSCLFTFPAHLNREYLQIFFFSTQYLKGSSVYLKGEECPQQHNP